MVTGGVKMTEGSVDIGRDDGETLPEFPVPAEKEDPEVILARRNAEHRRMQVRSSSRLATHQTYRRRSLGRLKLYKNMCVILSQQSRTN